VLTASANREALTPTNVNAEMRQRSGVSGTRPVDALGDAVFEGQAKRAISAAVFDGNSGSFTLDDITLVAEHVCDSPVKQLAWQAEPYGIVWSAREDGTLWASTYSSRQALAAWHRHTLGGTDVVVESIAVIPETDDHGESYDRLYLVVSRTIDGATVRFLEYLDSPLRPGHSDASSYYVDAGIVYAGASSAAMSGLDHLEGESVAVWASAAEQERKTVASGAITLDTATTVASIGLPFVARWDSLPFEAALEAQTTVVGVRSRIVDATLRLYRSLGGKIGANLTDLREIPYRRPSHAMDTGIPPYTGLVTISPGNGYGNEGTLAIEVDSAAPFHLVSVAARMEWSERA